MLLRVESKLVWEVLSKAKGTFGPRNDGKFDQRSRVLGEPASNCMSSLMVSNSLSLLLALGQFPLDSCNDSFCRHFEVSDGDHFSISPCSNDSSLVTYVHDVSSAEPRGQCCNLSRVFLFGHLGIAPNLLQMNVEDLLTLLYARQGYLNLTVKATWALQGLVDTVSSVGRSKDDDRGVRTEPVHLNEELVECVVSFLIATTHPASSLLAYSVDFIDEDD